MEALALIAAELGLADESREWARRSDELLQRTIELQWDEAAGLFWARHEGEPIRVKTPFSLFPLCTGRLPKASVDRLAAHLADPSSFWPAYPVPTVALDDPTTLAAFIADFRTRYPQYDQDLDSTATNVSATYAFSPPNPIVTSQSLGCRTNRVGDNLTLNVTGNGALLHYQWRRNGANIFDTGARTGTGTRDLFFHPLTTDDS